MGKLTTHVLDTARGKPAAGMAFELFRIHENGRELLLRGLTNADGRCNSPLLADTTFQVGMYELDFHSGDYFAMLGVTQTEPRFLDVVTLRFGVADAKDNLHVPLLVSPYSYSTYGGS
ncbi:MAG: hydroxyisourate hydrolase [Dokdonella sp.]|nr:MAG: hydroxyisourate hydrolase [Dokdonella sp.]